MKPAASASKSFGSAVCQLALTIIQCMGLHISTTSWSISQDECGVTVHFPWTVKRSSQEHRSHPTSGPTIESSRFGVLKNKPPSRQRRDQERWKRHKATRKQASRVRTSSSTGQPTPEVCVVALENPNTRTTSLNVDAPVFQPQDSTYNNQENEPRHLENDIPVINAEISKVHDSDILPFNNSDAIEVFDPTAVIKEDLICTKAKLQRASKNHRLLHTKAKAQIKDYKLLYDISQDLKTELLQSRANEERMYRKYEDACEQNVRAFDRIGALEVKLCKAGQKPACNLNHKETIASLKTEAVRMNQSAKNLRENTISLKEEIKKLRQENRELKTKQRPRPHDRF